MYICAVERLTKYNINCISIKRTITNFLKIIKMKGKKSPVRTYRFILDVLCKQFFLNGLQFSIASTSLRSAWRIAKDKSKISDYIAYLGYPDITVQKVYFVSCDIYALSPDCRLYKVKSVDKIR